MFTSHKSNSLGWATGLALLLLLAGCLMPRSSTSTGPLSRHNWWNYYQRGVAFLAASNPAAARADFECALGLRDGARFQDDQDRWRARTYGLHTVEGYFPNRELGVAFYELHDLTSSVRWLERSLAQTPSARAKHYLNLAHAQQAQAEKLPPPGVVWEGTGAVLTRERSVRVQGCAVAAGFVSRLSVAGALQPMELAQTNLTFATHVDLQAGTNAIEVQVTDLAGQQMTARRFWIADWRPPVLSITRVTREANGQWHLAGICRDDYAIATLSLNAVALPRPALASERAWPFDLRIGALGATLTAVDRAGNRLETRLTPDILAADAARRHPETFALVQATDTATDAAPAAHLSTSTTDVPGNCLPPALTLRGIRDISVVCDAEFFLDGSAADNGGLQHVTVNGEELLTEADQGAVRACFAHRIPLALGTNTLEVAAQDRAGNRTTRPLTVIRREPEYLATAMRLAVAVPPLLPLESADPRQIVAQRSMEAELTHTPMRFRLLERNEGLDYILQEQELSASDLADKRAALRIGKLFPAELIFMGRIIPEARGLTIYVKAVDSASGEILFATDVYSADPDHTLTDDAIRLTRKLKQAFPLVEGQVLQRQGATASLNLGLRDGVIADSRFVVVRTAAEGDLPGGTVRRTDGQPLQLFLEHFQTESSTARITPEHAQAAVKEGDHVYAR